MARRHAQRGVAAPGRRQRAQAQGRPLLRPLRQRRRHPQHARPPRPELPRAHVLGHQVHPARAPRPALPALRHRPLLGPVRRRRRPRGVRRLRQRPHGVPLGRHRAGAGPAGGRDADRQRGPPVRARRPPARPHRRRPQGRRVPADGLGPGRGLRRRRPGRGPAGGVGADLPRAPRPGGRPPGLRGREGGGPLGARVHGAGGGPGLRGRRGRRAAPPAGARGAGRSAAAAELAAHHPRRARRHRGAAAGRQARPAGDGHTFGERGPGPPPAAARRRPQRALEGADRAAVGAVAARGAAAHRVLRHEPPAGDRLRGLHGRVRGRPVQALGLPALQGQVRPRQRRLRRHGRGADAAAHRPEAADRGTGGRTAAPLRLPPQPDRRRRGQGPARGGRAGRARARARRRGGAGLAGQAVRGGLPPGLALPGAAAPGLRCPLPAAAAAGRGAPLRHHLPPGAARQADDQERPRRHPRPGAGPQGPPGQGAGRGERRPGRPDRGTAVAVLAARQRRTGRLRGPAQCCEGTGLEGDERVRGGHGDVRRRPFDGGGGPRGRGLVRHRQPAGRPDHEDGRDGGPPRVRHRAGGARDRPRGRQHGLGVLRGPARRAR